MQVFKPNDEIHTLVFIPRIEQTDIILKITNDLRSTTNEINISGLISNSIFYGNFSYNFSEGGSYELEVLDQNSRVLFRGKAFATDIEDLQNYKLIR